MMPKGVPGRSEEADDFGVTFGEDGKQQIC